MRAIIAALREPSGENDEVRVAIVRAEGPAFSAGTTWPELRDRTLEDERAVFDTCVELMTAVHDLDRPVIAEVAGAAFAAGCQLVATCDLAVASTEATFSTPACGSGSSARHRWWPSPGGGPQARDEDAVDRRSDRRGHRRRLGAGQHAVEPGELASTVRGLALRIAGSSRSTVSIGKRAFYAQVDAAGTRMPTR